MARARASRVAALPPGANCAARSICCWHMVAAWTSYPRRNSLRRRWGRSRLALLMSSAVAEVAQHCAYEDAEDPFVFAIRARFSHSCPRLTRRISTSLLPRTCLTALAHWVPARLLLLRGVRRRGANVFLRTCWRPALRELCLECGRQRGTRARRTRLAREPYLHEVR